MPSVRGESLLCVLGVQLGMNEATLSGKSHSH